MLSASLNGAILTLCYTQFGKPFTKTIPKLAISNIKLQLIPVLSCIHSKFKAGQKNTHATKTVPKIITFNDDDPMKSFNALRELTDSRGYGDVSESSEDPYAPRRVKSPPRVYDFKPKTDSEKNNEKDQEK